MSSCSRNDALTGTRRSPTQATKAISWRLKPKADRQIHTANGRATSRAEGRPAEVDLHLIMDNYATHKTEAVRKWLVRHPRIVCHFIPTSSSWLNLVERWFREITEKKDLGGFDTRIILTILNYLTYIIALVALGVLNWLRFVFLSLLYVFGPVLIAFGVYKSTSQGLAFWLKSLVSVSLWTVVLSILMKVISVMNVIAIYLPEETNAAAVIAANVLFILLFISVPLISHQITSSGSISGLGSAVVGIGTAFIAKYVAMPARPPQNKPAPAGGGTNYK
jgi:transposase